MSEDASDTALDVSHKDSLCKGAKADDGNQT